MASGEMSEAEFIDFLQRSLTNHADHCRDGAIVYFLHGLAPSVRTPNRCTTGETVDIEPLRLGKIERRNGVIVSLPARAHPGSEERPAPHQNNVQLGRYGRYRTNIWTYEGANSIRASRREELALHPTIKLSALVADAIKDVTKRGDLVLDGFIGSGTTLGRTKDWASLPRDRLDPVYIDIAIQRWQSLTGEDAVHAESGMTFDQLAASRTIEPAHRTRKRRKPSTMEG